MRNPNRRTALLEGSAPLLWLLVPSLAARSAAGRRAAPKLEWRGFTSEAGRFSVKLPGGPRVSHPEEVRGAHTIRRDLHVAAVGDDYVFHVDYSGLPGEQRRVRGREVTVTTPFGPGKTGFVQGRVFNSGRRYYMPLFVATGGSLARGGGAKSAADLERFFGSVKVTPK